MLLAQLNERFGTVACLLLILGVLSDWISTTMGLNAGLSESNLFASSLMEMGLWIPADLILAFFCILVPYACNRYVKNGDNRALYAFPLLAGLVRLVASLWNLSLLL